MTNIPESGGEAYELGRRDEHTVHEPRIIELENELRLKQLELDAQVPVLLEAVQENLQRALRAERQRNALLKSLPKCDALYVQHEDRPATKAWMRGDHRYCDECAQHDRNSAGEPPPDYPRAEAIRDILAATPFESPMWGVVVRQRGEEWVTQLFVQGQAFDLGPSGNEEHARFIQRMLLKALERLGLDPRAASTRVEDTGSDW